MPLRNSTAAESRQSSFEDPASNSIKIPPEGECEVFLTVVKNRWKPARYSTLFHGPAYAKNV
jgi:hypothetical protein